MESEDIHDDDITASSIYASNYCVQPQCARLNKNNNWAARNNEIGEWLQVDLRNVKRVTGTMIQGAGYDGDDEWVKSFKLQYGVDENSLVTYRHNGGIDKVFRGNTNRNTPVTNLLDHPVDARYVRFYPQAWNVHISMRVEILGCDRESDAKP
ncbi:EGF-like repeat and discoidin I-like domain-containing protein 3 [Branchiostoma floridae x Branchiostoma belcheri]